MKTRQNYLDKECTHSEYYAQFVDAGVLSRVRSNIGEAAIKAAKDKHFNDIPLGKWDNLYPTVPMAIASKMREAGDYATLAGMVCIAKEAARQIKEGK